MDWPVPYNWSAALGAPIGPMTWWSWHRPPLSEPVTDEGCVEAAALELELIGIVYGVLVEEIACADCGGPLDRSVKVELVRRTFAAPRIVVATRCCGWQGHTDTLREWSNAPGTCGLDNSLWTAATDETRELVIHLNSNTPTSRRRHLSPDVHVAHPAAQVPSLIALRSGTGVALITATVLASMAGFLDASVVNVAVPAIAKDLGASVAALQWTLTGYLLTAAALLLVAGALADSYGRRRVLVTGLLVMLAASAGCAVAPSFAVLIGARIVQGVGAALVVPSSLALLNGTLRVPDRAPGIGIWAGLASLGGLLIGPFVGGWLVDNVSWRAIFLLNVPLIGAAVLALIPVPESVAPRGRFSLDGIGALLAVVGLAGLIDGLTAGPTAGWTSLRVVAGLVVGAACLIALVPTERRVRAPMLKLSLFASRQFSAINLVTVVFYGALAAAGYLLVLRCELTLGYTATEAGALLIPSSVIFLVLSPISGALVPRVGARWLMTAGILAVAIGFLWLAYGRSSGTYGETILPAVLLWGIGLGLTVTPLTAAVLAAVSDTDLGEASAISDVAARLGAAIMTALVPVLIGVQAGRDLAEALVGGYRPAMIALTGLCVAAAALSAIYVRDCRVAGPAFAAPAPYHGCVLPDPGIAPTREPITATSQTSEAP